MRTLNAMELNKVEGGCDQPAPAEPECPPTPECTPTPVCEPKHRHHNHRHHRHHFCFDFISSCIPKWC